MKSTRIFWLTLAVAFCGCAANAEELTGTLKNIKETGAITLGYRDSSIPFSPISTTARSRSAMRWTSATGSSKR
jgi:hypothetical protein